MSWSEEVHDHRTKIERRREKQRSQGIDVDETTRANILPLAVIASAVVGFYVWVTDRHKLKHKGLLGRLAFFPKLLGIGRQRPDPRAAARDAAEARLRSSQAQGSTGSRSRSGSSSKKKSSKKKKQRSS